MERKRDIYIHTGKEIDRKKNGEKEERTDGRMCIERE
jgi:hypothetical protein